MGKMQNVISWLTFSLIKRLHRVFFGIHLELIEAVRIVIPVFQPFCCLQRFTENPEI